MGDELNGDEVPIELDLDVIGQFLAHPLENRPWRAIVHRLVAEVRELREQRDAARAEVMGELLDATRRAEQAEQAVARVREAVTEYMEKLGGQVPLYYRERIQAALDGGEAS